MSAPRVVDGSLAFAPCPVGCPGEGSSLHTAHRLEELGRPVPRYLETQIAFQLEEAIRDVTRMALASQLVSRRKRDRMRELARPKHERVRALRAWVLRVAT